MKFLAAVTICLVLSAGAQASFFDDLKSSLSGVGTAFKNTFNGVLEQGKQLGTQLLGQATQQGGQLLSQAAQSLLLNVMNGLQSSGTAQPAQSRRDLVGMVSKAQSAVDEVKQMFTGGISKFQGTFDAALNKLKSLVANVDSLSVEELAQKVDSIVSTHNSMADTYKQDLVNAIAQKLAAAAQTVSNKRDLNSIYQTVQSGMDKYLQPNVDILKQIMSHVGDNLKQTATGMQGAVNKHLGDLSTQFKDQLAKFQDKGQELMQKGQVAVNTMKGMVDQSMLEQ